MAECRGLAPLAQRHALVSTEARLACPVDIPNWSAWQDSHPQPSRSKRDASANWATRGWCSWQESHLQPPRSKRGTLIIELQEQMVAADGNAPSVPRLCCVAARLSCCAVKVKEVAEGRSAHRSRPIRRQLLNYFSICQTSVQKGKRDATSGVEPLQAGL